MIYINIYINSLGMIQNGIYKWIWYIVCWEQEGR